MGNRWTSYSDKPFSIGDQLDNRFKKAWRLWEQASTGIIYRLV